MKPTSFTISSVRSERALLGAFQGAFRRALRVFGTPPPALTSTSAFFLPFFLLSFILHPLSFAETEVSGAVSGEWTREGSPYIVVDSTWVEENASLLITEGVDVFFNEDQGLYVFGRLNGSGTEEDSIRIRVSEDVEHWRGMRFNGRNQTEWTYTSIICPDSGFVLDPNSSLTMDNSLIHAYRPIAGDTHYGIRGCRLTLSQSIIRSKSHHITIGSTYNANHTLFDFSQDESNDPGFWGDANIYYLTGCDLIGTLHNEFGGYVIADSCRFLKTPLGRGGGVVIGIGRMTNSIAHGGASVGQRGDPTLATFTNNEIAGSLSLSGSVNAENCLIAGSLGIYEGASISVKNCLVHRGFGIDESRRIIIDSCTFTGINFDNNEHNASGIQSSLEVLFTRNVLKTSWLLIVFDNEEIIIDHNTIEFDPYNRFAISSWPEYFTNNIIYNINISGQLFEGYGYDFSGFNYNCVYGFDTYTDPVNPITEFDSTNIVADPQLAWDNFIPRLDPDSPCIDMGDPDYHSDPDETRSDIGAIFYDHRFSAIENTINDYSTEPIGIDIYPNPFNNSMRIVLSDIIYSWVKADIFDITGRWIMNIPINGNFDSSSDLYVNTSTLSTGNYTILVQTPRTKQTIVVQCLK